MNPAFPKGKTRTLRLRLWVSLGILALVPAWLFGSAPQNHEHSGRNQGSALVLGVPRTELIDGKNNRSFALELTGEKDFVLTVEQGGIDVVVSLRDEGGQEIHAVDSPIGKYGPELLLVPAGLRGPFSIEVRAKMAGDRKGTFVMVLEQRTFSQPIFQRAERAMEAGCRFFHQNTWESRSLALEQFEVALPLWERIGEQRWCAITLFSIGRCAAFMRDWQRAENAYRRALPLWLKLEDVFQQAHTLNNLARTLQSLGEAEESLALYKEAMVLFKAVDDPSWLAAVLVNIASVWESLGEPEKEEHSLKEALAIWERSGDRIRQAWGLNNLGALYRRTGEWQKAFTGYRAALAIAQDLVDSQVEARILNNFGVAYMRFGDPRKAAALFESALPIRRQVRDQTGELVSLINLAWARGRCGESEQALAGFSQAIAMSREQKRTSITAAALDLMGVLLMDLERFAEALPLLEEAGTILAVRGRVDRRANNLCHLGQLHLAMGKPRPALDLLDRALVLFGPLIRHAKKAEALMWKARAQWALGKLDEAQTQIAEAAAMVESQRSRIGSHNLRTSYFATQQDIFTSYVALLMERHRSAPHSGYAEAAWRVHERARARGLMEMLAERERNENSGRSTRAPSPKREVLLRQLHAKTQLQLARIGEAEDTPQAKIVEAAIQKLLLDLDGLEHEWETANPGRALFTRPPAPTVAAMVGLLGSDTLLLEYYLGEAQSGFWVIGSDFFAAYPLPPRQQIEKLSREALAEMINPGATPSATDGLSAASRLSALLLGPVADRIEGKRLAIVADGALYYLPFGALPLPARQPGQSPSSTPLMVRHGITVLPSASVLGYHRRTPQQSPANRTVAILADPIFHPDDKRLGSLKPHKSQTSGLRGPAADNEMKFPLNSLSWAQKEAHDIADLAGRESCRLAVGFDANRTLVLSGELQSFSHIHFATHGLFSSALPESSAILLSTWDREGKHRQGLLGPLDIHGLDLSAELVVLSGCQTALGKELRGEGLLGLTRGFHTPAPDGLWPAYGVYRTKRPPL